MDPRPFDEALLDTRSPAEFAVAPDGETLAFALQSTVDDVGHHSPSEIWLGGLDGPAARLTDGRAPAWSPDGTRLAFLSDRIVAGHMLPYVIDVGTGAMSDAPGPGLEPRLAATLHGSAESVAWSDDGQRLLVLAADPGLYALDWSARAVTGADGVAPRIRRPGEAWRRLFLIDLERGAAVEVGPPRQSVWEFDWDGADVLVALVSDDPSGSGWYGARVVAIDLATRTARPLYTGRRSLEGLALSPDSRHVAVVEGNTSDPGLLVGSVIVIDVASGLAADRWPGLETVGHASWADDERLWAPRFAGTKTALDELWLDGRRVERWTGDAFIGPDLSKPSVALLGDGTLIACHQGHGVPPELARFEGETADWLRLTGFNDALVDGRTFPEVRQVRWKADDGVEIEGRLILPKGAIGPLPLVLAVHGGPTWCWNAFFSDSEPNAVLLADAGYAVLQANPRGSSGRGHAFSEAVNGDPGGIDFRDVMAGIDWCIAQGVADPDRLGIAGLSYGGYMAAWAPTQTDRFAAAVAISVVADFRSFHLTSEVARWDEMILAPARWDEPGGLYDDRSPVVHAGHVRTPTLVIAGELDRCTPVSQGEMLYGALAAAGCETELIVLPGEGHVPVGRAEALEAIRATQAWFDRFMAPSS
jgi:dipeptidyl aminopeptidase/acylaminoacyl peptidase